MKLLDEIYINGEFVKPIGKEEIKLINPANKQVIGKVVLGNEEDTKLAIAAAKEAFKTYSKTTVAERTALLDRLHQAIQSKFDDIVEATVLEYGAPIFVSKMLTQLAVNAFSLTKGNLETFEFTRTTGKAKVSMEPLGVVGAITPWNANATHIANKIAPILAAGCTVVVKPSEMSAIQTQLFMKAVDEADVPAGVINFVNGRGNTVGNELTNHPDVAAITFTGSTPVGKTIMRGAADQLKRVVLELGGKSPNVILEDADFEKAIPLAIQACFINSGQACVSGSRLIVPESRLEDTKKLIQKAISEVKVGQDEDSMVGPMVSQAQYDRVQSYIKQAIEEGAELIAGGEGSPEGLKEGFYVKPTVFANVTNDMTIAREEVFGPVLSVITYKTEEEAVEIANDTPFGLQAYVSGSLERANRVASQILVGRVSINGLHDEPNAPFGGFKQSGIGRDFGHFAIEEYVEPKAIVGHDAVL